MSSVHSECEDPRDGARTPPYNDNLSSNEEESAPVEPEPAAVPVVFDNVEDAVQILIKMATMSPASCHDVSVLPIHTLLARLTQEPRDARVAEYRAPPPSPHPSSTLLLVLRRMQDEFREKKILLREKFIDNRRQIEEDHAMIETQLFDAHRESLQKLTAVEELHAPVIHVPTAQSIQILEKQLINDHAETVDAGTRRLAGFWKTKYEKTCEELVSMTEKVAAVTQDYTQLAQLSGRDMTFLERTLAALRDAETEEQHRGDSTKQQFLIECRRRGLTPDEVRSKRTSSVRRRDIQTGSPHEIPKNVSKVEKEEELALPPVECISENGYQQPQIREAGLRVEQARRQLLELDAPVDALTVTIDELEMALDEAHVQYAEIAGAIALNDELHEVSDFIQRLSDVEQGESSNFLIAQRSARDALREAQSNSERVKAAGTLHLQLNELLAVVQEEKCAIDVELARQRLLSNSDVDAEKSHATYLDAHFRSIVSECRLLRQEMFEVERRARGIETELEAKLLASDYAQLSALPR